jgi:N-carbamoyl-L-amino-acid hydrolase
MRTTPAAWDVNALLAEIADIGRDRLRGGYSRHVFDPSERSLREWFVTRSRDLDLDVEHDKNSNIWSYWGPRGNDTIATGSHLDSVPGGGAFDGPLGVASALSAVAAMKADGIGPRRPLAVVAFAEEEGSRFGFACLGSRLATGAIDPARARALTDADGVTFGEAAAEFGLDPDGIGRDDARLASLAAFVELHVEQGRGLVDMGAPVALASGILAHGRWRLAFTGEGNHAGTTVMADRRDPVAAAAAAILAAREIAAARDNPAAGSHARATVGRVVPLPGGTNVIASRADAWLDVRAGTDAAVRDLIAEIAGAIRAGAAEHRCDVEITEESYAGATIFDPALRDRLSAALVTRQPPRGEPFGGEPLRGEPAFAAPLRGEPAFAAPFGEEPGAAPPVLATGAGHDAGVLASVLPTAMLFVRNPTGVSHSPYETATAADCRAGADSLRSVLEALLGLGLRRTPSYTLRRGVTGNGPRSRRRRE